MKQRTSLSESVSSSSLAPAPNGQGLKGAPDTREILQNAVALEQAQRFADAYRLYATALDTSPTNVAILEGAARTATLSGDHQSAVQHLRAATSAAPQQWSLRERFAAALMQSGDLEEAESEAKALIVNRPATASTLNLLGVIQKRRGRLADAVETFQEAARIAPENPLPWYNYGNTLLVAGQFSAAIEPLHRAVALNPADAEMTRLLGRAYAGAGQHSPAMTAFAQAEMLNAKNPRVYTSRASALTDANAPDKEILEQIGKAIALEPDNLEHLRHRAAFLQQRSRYSEAEATHKEILAKYPDDLDTLLRLGHMLGYSLRRYEEANKYLRHALSLRPDDPRCLSGLCKSLIDSRYGNEADHIEEAGEVGRKLLANGANILPYASTLSGIFLRLADYQSLAALGPRSNLMSYWVDRMNVGSLHNQLGRVVTKEDRLEIVHWHREWGQRVERAVAKTPIKKAIQRTPREKIRIGIMSSDLRDHPVAYFALPIFEHYDKDRFEIYCYSFYPEKPDRVQTFIQQKVTEFRTMLQASDREVAQQIADDHLDVLFELGGSTRYNRLEVMAYRAAPLQVSWLGYPHSAGLSAIDHILVDPYLKPDDPSLLIEKPLEVAESWVVLGRLGFRDEPIEPGVPEDRAGVITFGTMNNPYKYTPELFAMWAEVMARVENSQFLFVRPESGTPSFRANVCREFAKNGIDAARIQFECVRGKHMRHYNRIDIALDTAPHTGGTTTCETLWMGVPTITLVGEAFFERLSYSNLSNAGLGDLCAFTRSEYIDIAVALAKDHARRLDLRQNLRTRLRTAPLGDAMRWVRNFEAATLHAVNGTKASG